MRKHIRFENKEKHKNNKKNKRCKFSMKKKKLIVYAVNIYKINAL